MKNNISATKIQNLLEKKKQKSIAIQIYFIIFAIVKEKEIGGWSI